MVRAVDGPTTMPSKSTDPVSASTRPRTIRRRVDLPEPLGPMSASRSPRPIVRDVGWRTVASPYRLPTPSRTSTASIVTTRSRFLAYELRFAARSVASVAREVENPGADGIDLREHVAEEVERAPEVGVAPAGPVSGYERGPARVGRPRAASLDCGQARHERVELGLGGRQQQVRAAGRDAGDDVQRVFLRLELHAFRPDELDAQVPAVADDRVHEIVALHRLHPQERRVRKRAHERRRRRRT